MTIFLGVRNVDTVNKETGEVIKGLSFWFAEDNVQSCFGFIPYKCWIPASDSAAFLSKIGYSLTDLQLMASKQCEPVFGRRNRLTDLHFKK